MKKYLLLTAIALLFVYKVNAQITVTASDLQAQLAIGNKITTFANFSVTNANIGAPGATSWNFSGLVSEAEFVTESKDKASSPYAADFPNAQYASYYEGTFAGVFSKTWVYNSIGPDYYTDGTGTVTTPQGINSIGKITFSPKKTHYNLPLNYNDSWNYSGTQTVATTITVPIIGNQTTTIVQNLSVTYTSDEYGKATMPDGKVLDALRIKEVSTLTWDQNTSITVIYHILTKTGESVSITVKDQNSTSGAVEITAINWTSGNGVSNPTSVKSINEIPSDYSLSQNYPNPFNPITTISFTLPQSSFVNLSIYEITGREVTHLLNQQMNAGTYAVDFNSTNLSSGIYLYKISAGTFLQTKKMILIK